MIRLIALVLLLLGLATGVPAARAQQSPDDLEALRRAIDALRESQQRIERELADIKTLLRARPAAGPAGDDDPKNVQLSLGDAPAKGEPTAKLVLVDFTDFQ